MKGWIPTREKPALKEIEIQRDLPRLSPEFLPFECIFGRHRAEVMHRGTAYCRACYDEKNRTATLLDP